MLTLTRIYQLPFRINRIWIVSYRVQLHYNHHLFQFSLRNSIRTLPGFRKQLRRFNNYSPPVQLPLQIKYLYSTESTPEKDHKKDIQENISDPEIWDEPAAWGLNRLADGISLSSGAVIFVTDIGKTIAVGTIKTASEGLQTILPKSGESIDTPEFVSDILSTTSTIVSVGSSTISATTGIVSSIGTAIGITAGSMVIDTLGITTKETGDESASVKALKRLASTTAQSYVNIVNNLEDTGIELTKVSKESMVDVVSHSLGTNTGKIVKESLDITENSFKAVYSIKSAVAKPDMLKEAAKNASQETFKTVIRGISNNSQQEANNHTPKQQEQPELQITQQTEITIQLKHQEHPPTQTTTNNPNSTNLSNEPQTIENTNHQNPPNLSNETSQTTNNHQNPTNLSNETSQTTNNPTNLSNKTSQTTNNHQNLTNETSQTTSNHQNPHKTTN
jgi:hypothetical protein